jgi:hypothetical protein
MRRFYFCRWSSTAKPSIETTSFKYFLASLVSLARNARTGDTAEKRRLLDQRTAFETSRQVANIFILMV